MRRPRAMQRLEQNSAPSRRVDPRRGSAARDAGRASVLVSIGAREPIRGGSSGTSHCVRRDRRRRCRGRTLVGPGASRGSPRWLPPTSRAPASMMRWLGVCSHRIRASGKAGAVMDVSRGVPAGRRGPGGFALDATPNIIRRSLDEGSYATRSVKITAGSCMDIMSATCRRP